MENFRARVGDIVDSSLSQKLVVFVLLVNAVSLGAETSEVVMGRFGNVVLLINEIIPVIFVVEVGSRWFARGWRFFREGWNVFDVIIIAIAFMPAGDSFAALRSLRILRILHIISVVPRMRHVVASLLRSLPAIGSILALLIIINYIAAVITTHLYGPEHPVEFGNIGRSMLTLFQLMTLEGWSAEVVRPVMVTHPYAVFLFIPYMLMTAFAILNLFTAVLVDSMQILQEGHKYDRAEEKIAQIVEKEVDKMRVDINALRDDLRDLRALLEQRK